MYVYRYVGINLCTLYGVLTLCLNLVPQKDVSGLKNPPRVYTAALLLHRVCRTKQLIQGSVPLGRRGDSAVWLRGH